MHNAAVLELAIARWNAGDLDGYLELYDPSIKLYGFSPSAMGKAEVTGFYRMIWDTLATAGSNHPLLTVEDRFENGPMLACRAVMSGHHRGPFMGFAPAGAAYSLPVITLMRFEKGKVVERWSNADMLGLLVQIGAVKLPG